MEGFLEISMSDFDYLCNENKNLREKVSKLEEEKGQVQERISELEVETEQWEKLKHEKMSNIQERIQMQGEENSLSLSLKNKIFS